MKPIRLLVVATALFVALSPVARAAVEIGKPAPDFTLTDVTGKVHKLSDYQGKTVVLEWTNPGCPVVGLHYNSQNMQETQKAAAADGVVWLSIDSGGASGPRERGDAAAMAWQKKTDAAPTAYFRDTSGKVGRLYGATATPHLFVIKADGTLAYKGAIDSGNGSNIATSTNYVKAALASIKAGQPVAKEATRAYGCAVKYGRDDS